MTGGPIARLWENRRVEPGRNVQVFLSHLRIERELGEDTALSLVHLEILPGSASATGNPEGACSSWLIDETVNKKPAEAG